MTKASTGGFGHPIPHDEGKEQYVLAALMRVPVDGDDEYNHGIKRARDEIFAKVSRDDFHSESNALIFRRAKEIHDDGGAPDYHTVRGALERNESRTVRNKQSSELDQLTDADGSTVGDQYLLEILNTYVALNSLTAISHAQDIREDANRVQSAAVADELMRARQDPSISVDVALDRAQAEIDRLRRRQNKGITGKRFCDAETIVDEWLWPGRFCIGVNLLAAPGSWGKSTVLTDAASRISTGREWPDLPGVNAPLGTVLFITQEEAVGEMRPRAERHGADTSKLIGMTDEELAEFNLKKLWMLEALMDEHGDVKMVVIDGVASFLGGANDYRDDDVRALLGPLRALAQRRKVAVVVVKHTGKADSEKAVLRTLGSVAWSNFPRMAWMVAKDKDDPKRFILACPKDNKPAAAPIAYRIPKDTGVIEWDVTPIEESADEILAGDGQPTKSARGPSPSKSIGNAKWLADQLRHGGRYVGDLVDAARADEICARPTDRNPKPSISPLYNARDRLPEVFPGHAVVESKPLKRARWEIVPPLPVEAPDKYPVLPGNSEPAF